VQTVVDEHRDGEIVWEQRTRRQEKARHVAHLLLRGVAPALCAVTCDDPGRVPVELGDPKHHPPGEGNREHLRAVRSNELDGYLTGGESTSVVLDGVPTDEFLELIDAWLQYCEWEGHIRASFREQLYSDAQSMKMHGTFRDEEIVAALVNDVLAGERQA
jgi:hypothetical protein